MQHKVQWACCPSRLSPKCCHTRDFGLLGTTNMGSFEWLPMTSEIFSICSLLLEYQDMRNIFLWKIKENYYSQSLRSNFPNTCHPTLSLYKQDPGDLGLKAIRLNSWYLGPLFGTPMDPFEPIWTYYDLIVPFGPIYSLLEKFGPIWIHLDLF